MSKKKIPQQAAAPAPKSATAKKGPTKGIFKQPLHKPQPWSFGGRGGRGPNDEGVKAQPDAERLAGKSRKVH